MTLLRWLARLVILAVIIGLVAKLVPGIHTHGGFWALLWISVIFSIVNAILGPVFKLLSLPLTLVTFGLIGLVINTGMVLLAAWVADLFNVDFSLAGWPAARFTLDTVIAAFLTSVVVSVVSALMSLIRFAAPGRGRP